MRTGRGGQRCAVGIVLEENLTKPLEGGMVSQRNQEQKQKEMSARQCSDGEGGGWICVSD